MELKALMAVALTTALALAGCADNGDDADGDTLQSGKAAIEGLVIDDRFRPVPGALVLLAPLGLTETASENGEFRFLNIDPGDYTLRVQADGHEGVPQRVSVQAGAIQEANVVLQRTVNEGGTIVTQEYIIFITCSFEAVVVAGTGFNCFADQSGDSEMPGFTTDLTASEGAVTYVVTEVRFNREDLYSVVIGLVDDQSFYDTYYAEADIDGDYVRIVNRVGEIHTEHNVGDRNVAFSLDVAFETSVFPHGEFYNEANEAGVFGAGADTGVEAQVVQSVFLGEPDVDLLNYCTLC